MKLNIDSATKEYMRMNGISSIEELLARTTKSEIMNKYYRSKIEYSMDTVLNIIIAIGKGIKPEFVLDKSNINQYKEIVKFFFADTSFSGDLRKGLLLKGRKGTGKTMAILVIKKLLEQNIYPVRKIINGSVGENIRLSIVRTKTLTTEYEVNGIKTIAPWIKEDYVCFDDLGEEDKNVKHYANNTNLMVDILTERYDKFIRLGHTTIATTNYTYESNGQKYFKQFYGTRVEDRMKEMFNEIVFTGESRRK